MTEKIKKAQLMCLPLEVEMVFGTFERPLRDLINMKKGSNIPITNSKAGEIQIRINDCLIAVGDTYRNEKGQFRIKVKKFTGR